MKKDKRDRMTPLRINKVETAMCQFTRIKLTQADQQEVKKLSGIMIPIYASVALVLLAITVAVHLPHSNDAVTVAKNSAPGQEATRR